MTRSTPAAVAPAPVEQNDLTRRRQMSHVSLEIPTVRSRSLGAGRAATRHRRGFRRWVIRLIAPLAGGVPSLEDHDQTMACRFHPVLQLDQFALKTDQFAEIDASERAIGCIELLPDGFFLQGEFELLVQIVDEFAAHLHTLAFFR
jgi:hypothetical protein